MRKSSSYLRDGLALKLLNEGVDALLINIDTDRLDNGLDVSGRWDVLATELEEEVCSEVLHFDGLGIRSVSNIGLYINAPYISKSYRDHDTGKLRMRALTVGCLLEENRRINQFNRRVGRRLKLIVLRVVVDFV